MWVNILELTTNHVGGIAVYKRLCRLLSHLVLRRTLPAFGRGNETTCMLMLWLLHLSRFTAYECWEVETCLSPLRWLLSEAARRGCPALPCEDTSHLCQLLDALCELCDCGVQTFVTILRKRTLLQSFFFGFSISSPLETVFLVPWLEKIMKVNRAC